MPDDTIQETGNRKEAARQTRQGNHHKVGKEPRRGSRNGRHHPSQRKESNIKSHIESHTKATQQKRPRQRQRKSKQVRLSKILKQVGRLDRSN